MKSKDSLIERLELFLEENVPTNPQKWSYYKSQAKKKFDVYPSAYANAWAAKQYKAAGGGWRKSESVNEDYDVGHQDNEPRMLRANLLQIAKYSTELLDILSHYEKMHSEVDFPHWWQAKIIKALSDISEAKHYLENQHGLNQIDTNQ